MRVNLNGKIAAFSNKYKSPPKNAMALALLDLDHMENNGETVRLLTLRQTAEALNVSPRTMLRLLWRNKLPAVKVGSQWRIRERDLINWLHDLEEL